MKTCESCDPEIHEGGCNWLDWMIEDAGGVCPHCGGPVTEIATTTPLGRLMDEMPPSIRPHVFRSSDAEPRL